MARNRRKKIMIVEYGEVREDYELEENSKCWFCGEVLDPYETVYVWELMETGEQPFVCKKCNDERTKK
jgi:hypothetical protein